jgi:hypothetical protein
VALQYSLLVGPLKRSTRPQYVWFWPQPADQSVPDRPPLTPYVFRPGGFWQTQKALLFPTPADQPVRDQPPLRAYVFRKGGLWQITRFALAPPQPAPVSTVPQSSSGGKRRNDLQLARWQYEEDLLAALAAGVITKDEWTALMIL